MITDPSILYDGTFDLTFLREGESVEAAGDGSGACYVTQPTGPGTENGMRLDLGQRLYRMPNGTLYASMRAIARDG